MTPIVRGVAQPGSALAWGARGRKFESSRPDQNTSLDQVFFLIFLFTIKSKNEINPFS